MIQVNQVCGWLKIQGKHFPPVVLQSNLKDIYSLPAPLHPTVTIIKQKLFSLIAWDELPGSQAGKPSTLLQILFNWASDHTLLLLFKAAEQ